EDIFVDCPTFITTVPSPCKGMLSDTTGFVGVGFVTTGVGFGAGEAGFASSAGVAEEVSGVSAVTGISGVAAGAGVCSVASVCGAISFFSWLHDALSISIIKNG
ncbi:MAG: hypothetical protein ABIP02_04290, partial [Arenimonas sp.]